MTLYVFDKDSGGKSACNGPCAGNWSPYIIARATMAASSGPYKDAGQTS
jgi:predicted lipoprotein with Yx(FWY)xxD motif